MSSEEFTGWRKATYSGNGSGCVEVGRGPGLVGVRDTKDRDGGMLAVPADGWAAFVAGVKAGQFDLS